MTFYFGLKREEKDIDRDVPVENRGGETFHKLAYIFKMLRC